MARPRSKGFWQNWRHFAAYVYLFICIFDFVAMPLVYEFAHRSLSDLQLIEAVLTLDPMTQAKALEILNEEQTWRPLTLGESGLFHVAFGAILGVAAWTRGYEKIERNRRRRREYEFEEEPFEEEPIK